MQGQIDWNAVTAICTAIATLIIFITAVIAISQLSEMKRATIAQAFSTVLAHLQLEETRQARRVLMHIREADFSKWTQEQIDKAEIACSTYDVVGILLKRKVIDPRMVTAEWHVSIIRCWERALPMTKSYRRDRGPDYWNDFEWLYRLAKQHSWQPVGVGRVPSGQRSSQGDEVATTGGPGLERLPE